MHIRRSILLIVLLGLTALGLSACGGGSEGTEAPEALSRAQYVKRADAICTKANSRQGALISKAIEDHKVIPQMSELQEQAVEAAIIKQAGLPPLREEAAELDELGGPAGDQAKAEAFVDALRQAIAEVEAHTVAFSEGSDAAFVPAERLAKDLHLHVCGGG